MRKLLKILFLLIVFVILAACAGVAVIATSPKAMQAILMTAFNRAQNDVEALQLTIKKQHFSPDGTCAFEDVSFSLKQDENVFNISFSGIDLSGILPGKEMVLSLDGGQVDGAAFSLKGLKVTLMPDSQGNWNGPAMIETADAGGFKAGDITARQTLNKDRLLVEDIRGESCQGIITGRATVNFVPQPDYAVALKFEGLDTVKMQSINPDLFKEVQGKISGEVNLSGPAGGLKNIDLDIRLNDGGQIQAKLLKPLLEHIPKNSQERQKLQKAIQNNEKIIFNKARLDVNNKEAEKISSGIQLKSEELNVDVNVTADIIIQGGMENLLANFEKLTKYLKGN